MHLGLLAWWFGEENREDTSQCLYNITYTCAGGVGKLAPLAARPMFSIVAPSPKPNQVAEAVREAIKKVIIMEQSINMNIPPCTHVGYIIQTV